MTEDQQLHELARLYGIQTSYIDVNKQRRQADPEALLLVLRAMGAEVQSFEDVSAALTRRRDEVKARRAEPVMVAWNGKLGGRRLDLGYHWEEVRGQRTFIISAPMECHSLRRCWGVFAPVYALHSKRNPSAGDFTDFESFMDWSRGLGASVIGTLPLLAAFLDDPFDPSPYSPASRLFWNEFYIDVSRVFEFQENIAAQRLAAERPRKTQYVDYREVMAWKRRILEELSKTFLVAARPSRLAAFGEFVRENRGVEDYARFRAVTDRQQTGWKAWPQRLRDGRLEDGDYGEATKNYHLYAQWIAGEQLQGLSLKAAAQGQMLYLDLPLGLHPESYDVWRNRDLFVRGVAGGAPPDRVFTTGQNWNFPPMHPEAMRLNGYEYVIAYIRNHLRFARLLRVDHVMGLHRLYWIPDELSVDKGVYVEYPAEELYAILSLESHRYQAGIIGENLGMVPPEVDAAMARHHMTHMYVAQYEAMGNPGGPLPPPAKNCMASLNTHDMPPLRAFLDGADIDDRIKLGFLNSEDARKERSERAPMRRTLRSFRSAVEFLARSMADIVLVNVEDLWGEVHPQNVPATTTERPNWRRRIKRSIERLHEKSDVNEELSHVFADRSRSLPL